MVAVLWGTTGSAQDFAPQNATPIVIGALRMAVGVTKKCGEWTCILYKCSYINTHFIYG